jgi:hypothetical protein
MEKENLEVLLKSIYKTVNQLDKSTDEGKLLEPSLIHAASQIELVLLFLNLGENQ